MVKHTPPARAEQASGYTLPGGGSAAVLDGLQQALVGLEERLRRMEQQTAPVMLPLDPMKQPNVPPAAEGFEPNPGLGMRHQLPANMHGHVIDQVTVTQYLQRFQAGQSVRINLAYARPGMRQGMSWGEVIAPLRELRCQRRVGPAGRQRCPGSFDAGGDCPACGHGPVVTKVYGLRDDGQWLYKVRVPGLTNTPDGMAFTDLELLSA